jgi:hypothetical protein
MAAMKNRSMLGSSKRYLRAMRWSGRGAASEIWAGAGAAVAANVAVEAMVVAFMMKFLRCMGSIR